MKKEIEFDMRLTDFEFNRRTLFKGALEIPKGKKLKKIIFKHHLNRKINSNLLSSTKRKIKFDFSLEMHPDWGEIRLEGCCNLESPDQQKISFCLTNKFPPVENLINKIIVNTCLKECRKIGLKEGIPFPPLNFLLKLKEK